MKKLHNVEPYRVYLRVWDVVEDNIVFETKDVDYLALIYHKNYVVRTRNRWTYINSVSEFSCRPRFVIKTEFGDEIPREDLPRYRYKRRGENPYQGPDVRYKKGNPNKIKRGYYHWGHWWDEDAPKYHEYPYKVYGTYRKIRTMNERRQNSAAIADYGYTAVRGRRRGHNLPSSWDDPRNSTYNELESWKCHSKRRKQWKPS